MLFRANHEQDDERARRLSVWLDRELDAETSRALEEELRRDVELQERVEELRELDTALAQWPAPPVTPDLRPAVLARVRAERHAGLWRRIGSVWGDLATTVGWATAGVLFGFILMTGWQGQPRTSAEASEEMALTMMMPQNAAPMADTPAIEGSEQ